MIEFFSKIFGSKVFSITNLVLLIVLMVMLGILGIKNSHLEKKVTELEKNIDTQEALVVDLRNQIRMKDLEIHYLNKGLTIAKDFDSKKEEALENESATKEELLQTIINNEEVQDWWNTPIPDDVLDLIACH